MSGETIALGFLHSLFELLTDWVLAIWPGVLGAVAGAYLGLPVMGFPGLIVGAALGAFAGTWIGHRLGLVRVRRITSSPQNDQIIYSGAAFALVVACYMLLHVLVIIGIVVAIAVLGLFWLSN